jgi:L-iditol 2-dehydrogenase
MPTPPRVPETMRAAVMYDVDDIRIEERPVPPLEPGDLLVRTGASGICSGDLMPWYVRRKAPFVFGHEPAGTIVAIGGATRVRSRTLFEVGERVFAHHHAPCFECAFCGAGDYVQCAAWRASALDPGGMAEYFRVPHGNVNDTLRLPGRMSFVDGSLVEPLACVVKSLRRAVLAGWWSSSPPEAPRFWPGGLSGRTIYVVGLGVMGLMQVALAKHLGARVFASDFIGERRDRAQALGAELAVGPAQARDAVRSATDGQGPEVVVCGPGTGVALRHAIRSVSAGGTVIMFTPMEPGRPFAFDQSDVYFRDLRLIASYSCGPDDTVEALRLIAEGVVSAARLGASLATFPLVSAAYDAMREAETVKSIVTFPELPAT